jgi:hypothetical protein
VEDKLREKLGIFEKRRINYKNEFMAKTPSELADWTFSYPGPRLIIVNTVQTAAVLAKYYCDKFGRNSVEHISTALTASDRAKTLNRIKRRLDDKSDTNWALIATSYVEAGVELSFRTGFRELGSLTSLLQTSGRVNRAGYWQDSIMMTFRLTEGNMVKSNPGIKGAAEVLDDFLKNNTEITPELVTAAIEKEIKLYGINSLHKEIIEREECRDFPFVANKFNVIESDTRLAVVDDVIADKVSYGKLDWKELQANSVQIDYYKLKELRIPEIVPGIYRWTLDYDDFVGYMAGVIQAEKSKKDPLIVDGSNM